MWPLPPPFRIASAAKHVGPYQISLTGRGFDSHHLHLRYILLGLGLWLILAGMAYSLPLDAEAPLMEPTFPKVPLGTDPLGRHIFTRLLRGWVMSMAVAGLATLVGLTIGTASGLLSGYYGGYADKLFATLTQVLWVVPSLLWAAVLSFAFGKSLLTVILAIGLSSWIELARLVRVETKRLLVAPFVEAARALGYTDSRVIIQHILPSLGSLLRVQAFLLFATAILIEAGLGFVGLSVPLPHVSLGMLLYESLDWLSLPQGQVQALSAGSLLSGSIFVVYLLSQTPISNDLVARRR